MSENSARGLVGPGQGKTVTFLQFLDLVFLYLCFLSYLEYENYIFGIRVRNYPEKSHWMTATSPCTLGQVGGTHFKRERSLPHLPISAIFSHFGLHYHFSVTARRQLNSLQPSVPLISLTDPSILEDLYTKYLRVWRHLNRGPQCPEAKKTNIHQHYNLKSYLETANLNMFIESLDLCLAESQGRSTTQKTKCLKENSSAEVKSLIQL